MDRRRELAERVRVCLARQLGEDAALTWLSDTESLTSAGIDSVVLITVVGELEQELGLVLPDDAVLEAASIGSLAEALAGGHR
ncbi:MAG: acyl carrier protein [Pseudonocardiaceae bacterium]